MAKERFPKFKGDVSGEVAYMAKVIKSCKTPEQLESAYTWAHRVIRSWEDQDKRAVEKEVLYGFWLRSIYERYDMCYKVISGALEEALVKMSDKQNG